MGRLRRWIGTNSLLLVSGGRLGKGIQCNSPSSIRPLEGGIPTSACHVCRQTVHVRVGGPSTCFKSALDDKPTPETLTPDQDWGDTWEGRHVLTIPTRLDNPRGSAFRSVKCLYPVYWVPPTHGGKDTRNNRIYHYANPDHGLYMFPDWVENTVRWCKDMSPSSNGSSLSLMELLLYVDLQTEQNKLNPSWIYRTLQTEPCLFLNTRTLLTN